MKEVIEVARRRRRKRASAGRGGVKVLKPTKPGQKPIKFREGALHRALGVPLDKPIPESKKRAALEGKYGPRVKKMATFAFKGALAAGRRTAAANRRKKAGSGRRKR